MKISLELLFSNKSVKILNNTLMNIFFLTLFVTNLLLLIKRLPWISQYLNNKFKLCKKIYTDPVDTGRCFNVYKTSIRRRLTVLEQIFGDIFFQLIF